MSSPQDQQTNNALIQKLSERLESLETLVQTQNQEIASLKKRLQQVENEQQQPSSKTIETPSGLQRFLQQMNAKLLRADRVSNFLLNAVELNKDRLSMKIYECFADDEDGRGLENALAFVDDAAELRYSGDKTMFKKIRYGSQTIDAMTNKLEECFQEEASIESAARLKRIFFDVFGQDIRFSTETGETLIFNQLLTSTTCSEVKEFLGKVVQGKLIDITTISELFPNIKSDSDDISTAKFSASSFSRFFFNTFLQKLPTDSSSSSSAAAAQQQQQCSECLLKWIDGGFIDRASVVGTLKENLFNKIVDAYEELRRSCTFEYLNTFDEHGFAKKSDRLKRLIQGINMFTNAPSVCSGGLLPAETLPIRFTSRKFFPGKMNDRYFRIFSGIDGLVHFVNHRDMGVENFDDVSNIIDRLRMLLHNAKNLKKLSLYHLRDEFINEIAKTGHSNLEMIVLEGGVSSLEPLRNAKQTNLPNLREIVISSSSALPAKPFDGVKITVR